MRSASHRVCVDECVPTGLFCEEIIMNLKHDGFEACQWSLVLSIAMKRIDSIEASKTYRLYGVTDINITQLSSKR